MFVDGEFALLPYLPYTLVPFYPLFQTRGSQRIERNFSDWEVCLYALTNDCRLTSVALSTIN